MPCSDGGPSYAQQKEDRDIPAMLCALMTAVETLEPAYQDRIMNTINWREAGVSSGWFATWWARHKEEDRRRRGQEAVRAELERTRRDALSRLSPAERSALGYGG